MNQNTITSALYNNNPTNAPSVLTNPGGNNPWLFLYNPVGSQGGLPVVLEVPTTAANAIDVANSAGDALAGNKGEWYADGRSFQGRVVGTVAPNAFGKTFKLYLFAGNGLQNSAGAVADQQLASFSVTLPATGSGALSNWYLKFECIWDSASLQLTGVASGQIAGQAISSVTFSIYNPSLFAQQQAAGAYLNIPFVIGANINSTANATPDTVTLIEFTADMN